MSDTVTLYASDGPLEVIGPAEHIGQYAGRIGRWSIGRTLLGEGEDDPANVTRRVVSTVAQNGTASATEAGEGSYGGAVDLSDFAVLVLEEPA